MSITRVTRQKITNLPDMGCDAYEFSMYCGGKGVENGSETD